MSLHTDSTIIKAIKADSALMGAIGGRLYGTAIPLPEEDADNVPTPFAIVTYDAMVNDSLTKDDLEGGTDTVTVSVQVAASTLEALHTLTQAVRDAVRGYVKGNDTDIVDYQLSARGIQYDDLRRCYWQTLTYQCETENE